MFYLTMFSKHFVYREKKNKQLPFLNNDRNIMITLIFSRLGKKSSSSGPKMKSGGSSGKVLSKRISPAKTKNQY